mmetsp:Transcript_82848/g.230102  ORF Transcript_82848/g.230102 Transcript_82848/m.230102 type:complete len:203 (-) Transcript_82848:20-628(-)
MMPSSVCHSILPCPSILPLENCPTKMRLSSQTCFPWPSWRSWLHWPSYRPLAQVQVPSPCRFPSSACPLYTEESLYFRMTSLLSRFGSPCEPSFTSDGLPGCSGGRQSSVAPSQEDSLQLGPRCLVPVSEDQETPGPGLDDSTPTSSPPPPGFCSQHVLAGAHLEVPAAPIPRSAQDALVRRRDVLTGCIWVCKGGGAARPA